MNKPVQQLVPLHGIGSTIAATQSAVQTPKPQNIQPPPAVQVHGGQTVPTTAALSAGQTQGQQPQSALAIRPIQSPERAHTCPAPAQIASGRQRGEDQSQGHRSMWQPSSVLPQVPQLQQSQRQIPQGTCALDSGPVGHPQISAAPVVEPAARAPPQPPAWLLQDIIELARSSSVVAVHPDSCILKQRVAICFPEDHELSFARRGKTVVTKGVYDGKVLQVCASVFCYCWCIVILDDCTACLVCVSRRQRRAVCLCASACRMLRVHQLESVFRCSKTQNMTKRNAHLVAACNIRSALSSSLFPISRRGRK